MSGRDETSTPTQQVDLGNAFPFKADLFPLGIAFLGSCPDFPRNRASCCSQVTVGALFLAAKRI